MLVNGRNVKFRRIKWGEFNWPKVVNFSKVNEDCSLFRDIRSLNLGILTSLNVFREFLVKFFLFQKFTRKSKRFMQNKGNCKRFISMNTSGNWKCLLKNVFQYFLVLSVFSVVIFALNKFRILDLPYQKKYFWPIHYKIVQILCFQSVETLHAL